MLRVPTPTGQTHPAVAQALRDCRRAFWSVAIFSAFVNLMMLAGPLYMLQVYDRVLGSRSVPTLIALSIFLVGAYAFQGLMDAIRGRVVVRIAGLLDKDLSTTVHAAVIRIATHSRGGAEASQPVRDLDQIRAFFNSAGPIAIVDLPWVPVFLGLCFLVHLWLGVLAVGGGVVLMFLTFLTERASRAPQREVGRWSGLRGAMVEADRSNSETITAMGMTRTMSARWSQANQRYLDATSSSTDVVGTYGSMSKVFRMTLQSAILGLGAFLVIKQELSSGSMIAASIMVGRALAPIETAIANWRTFLAARLGIRRLSETLARIGAEPRRTALPAPSRTLEVETLAVAIPGSPKPVLSNIGFTLDGGEAMGIVGPSGCGKTCLVRTLVGVWPVPAGSVRIDTASLDQWDSEFLGRHIGFLSQSIELFNGTIAENIARMASEPDSEAVLKAAQAAGAHDMILRLPGGYDAVIGDGGAALSAGQRQRVALARALYGDPFLIVLDEPNSNLDNEGEAALHEAIRKAKARGAIAIIIAHRPSALAVCDKVLYLSGGTVQAYGPRDEVLRKIVAPPTLQPVATALHSVREAGGRS